MRTTTIIFTTIVVMLSGCVSDDGEMIIPECNDAPSATTSRFRSPQQATDIAQQAINALDGKSRNTRTLKGKDGVTVIHTTPSRSGVCDTIMYAIDLDDEQGFVLIAGPTDMSPLLAVVESGYFADPKNLENENYQFVLNATKNFVLDRIQIPIKPIDPTPSFYVITDSVNYKYEPSVKFNWNQAWPEGMFAPNKIAGCVPLATVTAMAVLEYPKNMTYTFPEKDISYENIDWSMIKKHIASGNNSTPSDYEISQHYNYCGATEATHKTLARLIRQAGHICDAQYLTDVTSVLRPYAFNAIKKYIPSTMYYESDPAMSIFKDLRSYKVAMIDYYDSNNHGHTWIADGIWRLGMVKYYYELLGAGSTVPNPGDIPGEDEYVLV